MRRHSPAGRDAALRRARPPPRTRPGCRPARCRPGCRRARPAAACPRAAWCAPAMRPPQNRSRKPAPVAAAARQAFAWRSTRRSPSSSRRGSIGGSGGWSRTSHAVGFSFTPGGVWSCTNVPVPWQTIPSAERTAPRPYDCRSTAPSEKPTHCPSPSSGPRGTSPVKCRWMLDVAVRAPTGRNGRIELASATSASTASAGRLMAPVASTQCGPPGIAIWTPSRSKCRLSSRRKCPGKCSPGVRLRARPRNTCSRTAAGSGTTTAAPAWDPRVMPVRRSPGMRPWRRASTRGPAR